MMDFETAMRSRFSCRKMTSELITEEELQFIIEAGRLAPLAAGDNKTSHLTVVHGGKLMEDIREACMYTRKDGSRMDPLYGASTIIFFSATDISDDHIEYANAGCVIENMCLAATSLGLGSCYIWGCLRKLRKQPELIEKLQLPEGHEILSAFVCGHTNMEKPEKKEQDMMQVTRL